MAAQKSATEHTQLSERAQILLKSLIEKYIEGGQPVGSRTLASASGLELSPATIRNVLADLEDMGLIASPHTSAGRIPTNKGYRVFVDSLVKVAPMRKKEVQTIQRMIKSEGSHKQIVSTASDILSEVTRMTSLVMLPRRTHKALRQIEFLPLSENRVLAIVVINDCEVENRILHLRRSYTQSELQKIANYLNSVFGGREISEVRRNLLTDLNQARQDVNDLMTDMVEMADKLFPDGDTEDLVMAGKTNLLGFQELTDTEQLRKVFDTFKQKQTILEVLDQCLVSQGVQIFIGSECGVNQLEGCSIISSPYKVEGETVGVLGVIGPTRMNYDRVISVVDITAKLLGSALEFK
ncbi:MAG: heat-inducible transcriptional repressor HrcA [Gammaproteobacteria bacterium]|nr:heat-inducible transcriptional repressor HrcA [Gammaproteobacteria bacterium]